MFFYSLMTSLGFHFKYSNTRAVLLILCNQIVWRISLLFENRDIYRFSCCLVHLDKKFREDLDPFQGGIGHLGRIWTVSISSPNHLFISSTGHKIH